MNARSLLRSSSAGRFARQAVRPLYERCRQLKSGAQQRFLLFHAAVVDFMVIAGQVKHAVQNQYFHLAGRRVPKAISVGMRDVGANRNVTAFFAREGKYVRRLVLATETPVELLDLPTSGNQDGHVAGDACQLLRAHGKASQ